MLPAERPLRIVRTRLYEVALPLTDTFVISGGALTERRSLIVELEDDEGRRGFGESAPFVAPFYSSETVASARAVLCDWLLPRVIQQPVDHPRALDRVLSEGIRGNEMARAGVDTAWWDLLAQRASMPLVDLVTARLRELGVSGIWLDRRDHVVCGVALGIPSGRDIGRLREQIEQAVARGYRRVKIKIAPGWDRIPLAAARETIDGRVPLSADANGAYDPLSAGEHLRGLDGLALLYLEQPYPAECLREHWELSQRLRTPICLDESLVSEDWARQIVALGGPWVWNLKIQRVGGLERACRLYAYAETVNAKLWGGTMPESGLGVQPMLALGCHGGFLYPSDVEPSDRWFPPGADLIDVEMSAEGTIEVPGRGPILDLDLNRRGTLVYANR